MTSLPRALVVHNVPGRLRLRVPERRHDTGYFERVTARLAMLDTVKTVHSDPRVASILVLHGEEAPARIVDHAKSEGLFVLELHPTYESLAELINRGCAELDGQVRSRTSGRLDLASIAFIGMTGVGLSKMLRGDPFPAGFSMIWHAATLLMSGRPAESSAPASEFHWPPPN